MLISIELHDSDAKGRRLGNSRVRLTKCLAIKQSGDGLRMANLAAPLQRYYRALTNVLLQKDPDHPESDKADNGTYPVIYANLARYLSSPEGDANKQVKGDLA